MTTLHPGYFTAGLDADPELAEAVRGELRRQGEQIELIDGDDVLITPDLRDIGTSDFTRIAETFPFGYEATMAAADMLRPLALSPEAYAAHRATRPDPRQEAVPRIDFVRLNNDSGIGDNLIDERLKNIPTGVPLDVDALEYAIAELYGLELFQNVRYAVVDENGRTGLEVGVEERSWGPGYLQGGVQYSSAGNDETRFGLSVSYLRTQMNERGAEWRTTFTVGDEPRLYTEWHQPLGFNARAFLAADYTHEATLVNLYSGGSQIATVQPTEDAISVSAGREFGNWGEVRLGLARGHGETDLLTGSRPWAVYVDQLSKQFDTHLMPNWGDQTVSLLHRREQREVARSLEGDQESYGVNYSPLAPGQAFVLNRMKERVAVIDRRSGNLIEAVDVGGTTETASTTKDGRYLLLPISSADQFAVLDMVTREEVARFDDVGRHPWSVTTIGGQNYCH